MQIKVGLIEDEIEICESLKLLINSTKGLSCIHTFNTALEAISQIPGLKLDVVLTDIHLPDKSGIECVTQLNPLCPNTQFLMCTSFEDIETVFKALKAGASGYLIKTIAPLKLLEAIKEVYNGGSPMNSQIARKVVASFHTLNKNVELEKLSQREQEILQLLSNGFRYKEISEKLFISLETVRTHIRNIYEKLQVNSRTNALNKTFPK